MKEHDPKPGARSQAASAINEIGTLAIQPPSIDAPVPSDVPSRDVFGELELSQPFRKFLAEQQADLRRIVAQFSEPAPWVKEIVEQIAKASRAMQESFAAFSVPLQQFANGLERLPSRTRDALNVMGEHGWYLDLHMGISDALGFQKAVESGNLVAAEAAMEKHFAAELPSIRDALVAQFPLRRDHVGAAFGAIDRGEHILAIPVLLAQVDGICKDVANSYFFIKGKGEGSDRPGVSTYVAQLATTALGNAFMSPFEKIMPIGQSEKERPQNFSGLNRHMVLHGESLDYGTLTNSLKVVSLLNYVAQMLSRKLLAEGDA